MNMEESKILITNYPSIRQNPMFEAIDTPNKRIEILCGYDLEVNNHEITLQIARDLITAILTFDKIYIEGSHIWDIMQVFGSEYIKELLRLHIIHVIPDQELNPVMIKEDNCWEPGFFPYPQIHVSPNNIDSVKNYNIHKWSYIETRFQRANFVGQEANAILLLIDENSVDVGNVDNLKKIICQETNRDIKNQNFLQDPNFYRISPKGYLEYNQISIIRLQELNKSAILAAQLDVDNIKMDAAICDIMAKKAASAFSKKIHSGTDAIISIEQQKGFPDLGELFVNRIIDLDDIIKLRDNFQGRIFRYWVKKNDYDERQMKQEVMNSVHNILGSKYMNPIRMAVSNLIGVAGFLPGLVASAFDGFILDKISKDWHPNFFLDDKLKKMIDDCVTKEEEEHKRQKIENAFKGVRRNDLCPCGSGKKFKKCHGRNL